MMTVVTACDEHIPALIQLMSNFYSESGYVVDSEKARNVFHAYIKHNALGTVFLAVDNEVIIGYLIVKYYLTMSNYGFVCSLEDLYVNRDKRRNNAGSRLIEEAIVTANKKGIKNFNVEVGENNSGAIRLYEKYGFKIREQRIEIMEKKSSNRFDLASQIAGRAYIMRTYLVVDYGTYEKDSY